MDFTNLSYQELKEIRDAIDTLMQSRRMEALGRVPAKGRRMDKPQYDSDRTSPSSLC
jgi:hypothetical protein